MQSMGQKAALSSALLVVLAGCAAQPDQNAQENSQGLVAPEPTYDEATGAIQGRATDSEFVPVAKATVGIPELKLQTETAADGTFSFSKVPAGRHRISALKIGYESAMASVEVEAGKTTEAVRLMLQPMAVKQPRMENSSFNGHISCTIAAFALLSEECGNGVDSGVAGRVGQDSNNKIDWKFQVASLENLTGILIEMSWKPGSAAANELNLYIAHDFSCPPTGCAAAKEYCGGTANKGPPVLRCEILADQLGVTRKSDLPWSLTARAWGAVRDGPTDQPQLVLGQSFTMHRTDFYDMELPQNYTAFPKP